MIAAYSDLSVSSVSGSAIQSVGRVISPDMLCQFSKSFSPARPEIKQRNQTHTHTCRRRAGKKEESFKNLPKQRSFIRQTKAGRDA